MDLLDNDGWADHVTARLDVFAAEMQEDGSFADDRAFAYRWNGVTRPGFITNAPRLVADDAAFDHLTDCVQGEESALGEPRPDVHRLTDVETRTLYEVVDVVVGTVTDLSVFERVICAVLPREMPADSETVQTSYSVTLYRDIEDYQRKPYDHLAWYDWQSKRPEAARLVNNVVAETYAFSHVTGCG